MCLLLLEKHLIPNADDIPLLDVHNARLKHEIETAFIV